MADSASARTRIATAAGARGMRNLVSRQFGHSMAPLPIVDMRQVFRLFAGYDRTMPTIYKICTATEWRDASRAGIYRGSAVDVRDGFIHFSTAEQAAETAAKHFAGQHDLVLVAINADALGARLKWESSRGGALFPHLYDVLDLAAVRRVDPLPLDASGRHVFPQQLP